MFREVTSVMVTSLHRLRALFQSLQEETPQLSQIKILVSSLWEERKSKRYVISSQSYLKKWPKLLFRDSNANKFLLQEKSSNILTTLGSILIEIMLMRLLVKMIKNSVKSHLTLKSLSKITKKQLKCLKNLVLTEPTKPMKSMEKNQDKEPLPKNSRSYQSPLLKINSFREGKTSMSNSNRFSITLPLICPF